MDVVANAKKKLATKKCDLVVANDVSAPDAGFAVDDNRVTLVDKGSVVEVPHAPKSVIAHRTPRPRRFVATERRNRLSKEIDEAPHRRPGAALVVVLTATGGAANADRAQADAVWQKVTVSRDPHLALTCAADYMDVYNADPAAPGDDDVLTNAAECYEIARAVGAAITTSNVVLKSFPNSKDSAKAELRLGRLYVLAGNQTGAADHLEAYAKR